MLPERPRLGNLYSLVHWKDGSFHGHIIVVMWANLFLKQHTPKCFKYKHLWRTRIWFSSKIGCFWNHRSIKIWQSHFFVLNTNIYYAQEFGLAVKLDVFEIIARLKYDNLILSIRCNTCYKMLTCNLFQICQITGNKRCERILISLLDGDLLQLCNSLGSIQQSSCCWHKNKKTSNW